MGRAPKVGEAFNECDWCGIESTLAAVYTDAFPQLRTGGRTESAEAESPPSTQLYALRSRAAVAGVGLGSRAQPSDAISALAHILATASGGIRDSNPAASGVMDLSESQGPIKKRLKVGLQGMRVTRKAAASKAARMPPTSSH